MPILNTNNPEFEEAIKAGGLSTLVETVDFNEFEKLGAAVSTLHNDGEYDFLKAIEGIDWKQHNPRTNSRWLRLFEAALPVVKDSPSNVVEICHHVWEGVKSRKPSGVQAALEKWVDNNQSSIENTYLAVLSAGFDSPLVYTTLHAWRLIDHAAALVAAVAATHEPRTDMRRQAIQALGYYNYDTLKENSNAISRLLELAKSDQEDDQLSAVGSIINILENCSSNPDELIEELDLASENPSPKMLNLLVFRMARKNCAYSPNLRARLFDLMSEASPDDDELIDNIDNLFMSMNVEGDREVILAIITKILLRCTERAKFNIFDSFLYKLNSASDQTRLWYCVQWLLTGERKLCEGLADCFPPLSDTLYDFDVVPLGLSDRDIRYLCRKVFAYLMFCHGAAVSILASAIIALGPSERRGLEVEIASFWLRNYPGDMKLFAEASISKKSKALSTSIGKIKKAVAAYNAPLVKLPRNPALRPSTSQHQVQAELARERSKTIMQQADETSIFASLVTKSTMLYGRSSVIYMYADKDSGPVRQEIPLQSFETSSALPRMDVLYPARLQYILYKFRSEARPS